VNPDSLAPACGAGSIAYLDRCWETININADDMSVSFEGKSASNASVAIGRAVPSELKLTKLGTEGAVISFTKYSQHPIAARYSLIGDRCSSANIPSATSTLWGMIGIGRDSTPWATSSCLWTFKGQQQQETLAVFGVRATFAYGMAKKNGLNTLVHQWDYHGTLRVNGVDLPLPAKFDDVASAVGVPEKNRGGTERRLIWKRPDGSAIEFVSNYWLNAARIISHEQSNLMYVSDVWFYSKDVKKE